MSLSEILSAHNNNLHQQSTALNTNPSQSTIESARILKPKRSLNFISKKHEAERIDTENEKIM